jgi:hypothetical protein
MKALLPLVLAVGLAVGLATAAHRGGGGTAPAGGPRWERYGPYEVLAEAHDNDFDMLVTVSRTAGAAPATGLRLLLHCPLSAAGVSTEDCAAVTLTPEALVIAEVESGLAVPRARRALDFPLAAGEEATLCLQWREPYLTVLLDGRRLLSATLLDRRAGAVGVGRPDPALEVSEPVVQPVAPVAFTDDFMRNPDDVSPWDPAAPEAWEVRSLDNPSRSANAFVYQCRAPAGSTSLVGRPHWGALRTAVSLHGAPQGAAGILFNARDHDDAFLFRWTARELPAAAADAEADAAEPADEAPAPASGPEAPPLPAGVFQLVRLEDGRETVLQQAPGGYRPGQWYRVAVTSAGGVAECRVDGHLIFTLEDPRLYRGRVGLYARSEEPTEFDDLLVRSFHGRLDAPAAAAEADRARHPEGALLYGRPAWRGYRFTGTAQRRTLRARGLALVAAWRSPLSHLRCTLQKSEEGWRQAVRRVGPDAPEGEPLAARELPALPAALASDLVLDRGVLSWSLGAEEPLVVWVGPETAGRCGVDPAGAPLREVRLEPVEPPVPVATVNEVFDEERLMKIWSGAAGEWKPSRHASEHYGQVYWHRALFFDDVEVEALLPAEAMAAADGREEVALSVAKPMKPTARHNGYTLRLLREGPDAWAARLMRAGAPVADRRLPAGTVPRRLRLRRRGPVVLGYVDDEALVWHTDPAPLRGRRVAWAARGVTVPAEKVIAYSGSLESYLFSRAPADWRIGAGVWEIQNRWECDPRWHFWAGMPGPLARRRAKARERYLSEEATWMSESLRRQAELLPDPDDPHTVLWHKGAFGGDLMAEVYIAQMMDQSRGGGQYQKYVRDFNLTICADGRTLDSGYSCIFGGWGNTRSAIVREGRIVAASSTEIPLQGSHRRWVRLRAERHGSIIHFRAYTELAPNQPEEQILDLAFEDPEPLAGTRVAIWSYDNGVMVTRARLAARRRGPQEDPAAAWPATVRSIYSREAAAEEEAAADGE